jgi:hypothetical protein
MLYGLNGQGFQKAFVQSPISIPYREVDLSVTLSTLMGLPIAFSSFGKQIKELYIYDLVVVHKFE